MASNMYHDGSTTQDDEYSEGGYDEPVPVEPVLEPETPGNTDLFPIACRAFCPHEYVSGDKKGQKCGRFIRKHGATMCGVHTRQETQRAAKATEAHLKRKEAENAALREELGKPKPIRETPMLLEDQREMMHGTPASHRAERDAFNRGVRRDHYRAEQTFSAMMAPRRRTPAVDVPFWAMLN